MTKAAAVLSTFRVHFHDDSRIDVAATSPVIAEAEAKKRRPGNFVKKIKILREPAASSNPSGKGVDHG
jgi:hypothetical protein